MNIRTALISCTLFVSLSLICSHEAKTPTKKKSPHQRKTYSDAASSGIPQSSSNSSLQARSESPCSPAEKANLSRSPSPEHQISEALQDPSAIRDEHFSDDEYDFVETPQPTEESIAPLTNSSLPPAFYCTTPSSKMLTLIQNPKTDLSDRKTRREIEEGMHKAAGRNDAEQLLSIITALFERKGEIHDLGSIEAAYATLKKAQQETESATRAMNSQAQAQYNAAHAQFLNDLSRCFLGLYTNLDRIEEQRAEKETALAKKMLSYKKARTNCHALNPRLASSANPYVKEGCDSDDDSGKAERYADLESIKKSLRPKELLEVHAFERRARAIQKKLPDELTFFPKQGFPF